MNTFLIIVSDIENIAKPKYVGEFIVQASMKSEAVDKAHTRAQELFPAIKKLVETRAY